MDSRRAILDAIRAAGAPAAPLPDSRFARGVPPASVEGARAAPAELVAPDVERSVSVAPLGDPVAQFARALEAVAGALVVVDGEAALPAAVDALAARLGASKIVSAVAAAGPGNVRLDELGDPHEMEGVDLAVLQGALGVLENGAVWVPTDALRHRGIFVVAQHLAMVLGADALVPDLHAAYERIRFGGRGFGTFIAGPSKTADIEQALVIGAHGARSCTVFLVR